MANINVKINGHDIVLKHSDNVEQMLQERNVTGKMFVVEKNLKIIQKEDYSSTPIMENDVIEIVGFFGGG